MRYNMTRQERIEALKDDIRDLTLTLDTVLMSQGARNQIIKDLTISQIALTVIENDLIKL
jgi:hypothetical protein